ncbi:hypothetical protein E1B28_011194 [Marasmius oreades]|uniref:F-box domain-containing protein n=1 Tax=Marasmius oreades TaxID=181124 RepID=A0A9P7RUY4_9AGAR|nr:uncharacterized protein E1B28_011194 [Marasmius oreades]KAG7089518.1 hypothetical protein E1B28_011194 [Marasmius oreades]
MIYLPVELWLQIVGFIPPTDLLKLHSVNSFFFNIAMDVRYRRVDLQTLNHSTAKYLSRLSDPTISKRVVQLTVSPDFRNYGRQRPATMLNRVGSVFHYALGRPPPCSPEDHATKQLIDVLPCLTRVNSFTIDCHSWGEHSSPELHGFLQTAWASFGQNLRKLSLRGHTSAFRTIIHSITALPAVDELFIELIDNPLQNDPTCAETLIQVVAPFINGLAPRLRAFTLWSWGTIDLSQLFLMLDHFPSLSSFNLQTSFPKTFRQGPSGLSRFLSNHSPHLRHLVLRLNTAPLAFSTTSMSEEPLSEWMIHTLTSGECSFLNLQELHLYPTVLPGGLHALTSCIHQSTNTLQSLVVRDRYLSPEEAAVVINALHPQLKSLRLNIRILDMDLFDLLAKRITGLKSLSLYIGAVSRTFAHDVEHRSYATWDLYHIGVWHGGSILDSHLMSMISRSIPSLKCFWGNKNEIEDFGLR